jgi:hypothetical protein
MEVHMKKLFCTVAILLWGSAAMATPFVVSDDFEAGVVDVCVITVDDSIVEVAPSASSGGERCVYDVGSVSEGAHTVTMATKNVWGETSAVPFDFTKTLPPSITSLHLEP